VSESGHLELKRALEAAKRGLEADYHRKARTLDAAIAILEEIGPNLQPADMAKLVPEGVEALPIAADPTSEAGAESGTDLQPDSDEPASYTPENASARNGASGERFVLREQIQEVIKEFRGGAFYQKDVTERISEKYPDRKINSTSVSNTLSRLAKRGELRVVKPAHGGSDPALYKEANVS
jgi:hypothetical protein